MEAPLDQQPTLKNENSTHENSLNENLDVVQMNLDESLEAVRKAAYWFFGIAIFSIINIFLSSRGMYFIMGLGMSQIIDGIVLGATGDTNFLISMLAPGVFIALGIFAMNCHRWAFILGAVIYLLDAVIYLYVHQWLAFACHAFVLYKLWNGFKTISEYEALRSKLGLD